MQDVQAWPENRGIEIPFAGITRLKYPVDVEVGAGELARGTGTFELTANVEAGVKGTHMSRFVEEVHAFDVPLSLDSVIGLASSVGGRLSARKVGVTVNFETFVPKLAPATGAVGLVDAWGSISVELVDGRPTCSMSATAAVTTLCPCSREISDYGAHNQRSHVTVGVRPVLAEGSGVHRSARVHWGDLFAVADASGSCEIYSILKRPDERFVTMKAFDNPLFVEDVVRDVLVSLAGDERFEAVQARAENFESIHNHDAIAGTEWIDVRSWRPVGDGSIERELHGLMDASTADGVD